MKNKILHFAVYSVLMLIVSTGLFLIIRDSFVTGSTPLTGETISRTDYVGPFEMLDVDPILSLEVAPPELTEPNNPEIKIARVTYVVPNNPIDVDQICIDQILIYENVFTAFDTPGRGGVFLDSPVCLDFREPTGLTIEAENGVSTAVYPDNLEEFLEEVSTRLGEIKAVYYRYSIPVQDQLHTNLIYNPVSFWYPYDDFSLDFTMVMHYHLRQNGEVVYTDVSVPDLALKEMVTENWDISTYLLENQSMDERFLSFHPEIEQVTGYSRINIVFQRPLILKITYPIILFSMFLFVILLSRAESFDGFVQGSLAIMFGIFSLRELLVPSGVQIRTLLDLTILLLYLLFSLVIIFFIGTRLLTFSSRRHKPTTIPFDPLPGDIQLKVNTPRSTLNSEKETATVFSMVTEKKNAFLFSTLLVIAGLLLTLHRKNK